MDKIRQNETEFREQNTGMKSEIDSGRVHAAAQPSRSRIQAPVISKLPTAQNSGAVEKQFIINFDRRCTILLSEDERDALYSCLGDYRATRQINPFLDRLSQILNSPIKMELVDDVRHFVEERHIDQFDRGMPFGDLSSKVVRILNSTPSYDIRQWSTTTTPRLLSPLPMGDIDQQSSKGESEESKRIELTKGEEKQQLGFSLWGTSDGRKGVFIKNVLPRSLADSAGLRPGDRLLDINDIPLDSYSLSHVENLIERSITLRMHILRSKEHRRATSKNTTRRDEKIANVGQRISSRPPSVDSGRRRSNPKIEVSSPSAYFTKSGEDYATINKGHLKHDVFGGGSYDLNTPKQHSDTKSRMSDRINKIIPVRSTGRKHSENADTVILNKYETLANFPMRTKTVIDLNGKAASKDSDIIRIEEVDVETSGERSAFTPRSFTTPRVVTPSASLVDHQKSQSLQSLPVYQASTLSSSPLMGRNTRVIPIIRSYVPPKEEISLSNTTPTTHVYENRVIQPQLNLIPPNYQQFSQQSPIMQYNDQYVPIQQIQLEPTNQPRSRSRQSNNESFQNRSYYQEPQHYIDRHQFIDERRSLSNSPLPPVFPMVIPHYQAIPRRMDTNYSYLETQYPHPGMWKSMTPYRSPNKKLMQRRMKYLSVPDLSAWNRRKRNYYDRGRTFLSDLDALSEIYGSNRFDHPIREGWVSDHGVEYGQFHRFSDTLPSYKRKGYDYIDGGRSRFYGDEFRSMRDRRSRDYWDETESENSDFETLSTAFDPSIERRNRKFKEIQHHQQFGSNRFQRSNEDSFFDTPSSSKSSIYRSHASQDSLFKKDASNKEKIPKFFDDVKSPRLNKNVPPKKPRRSRYDKTESETKRNQVSPKYISGNISSNSYDQEFKVFNEITTTSVLNKLPKAQPRSKSPSISSISSNFSVTLINDKPGLKPLSTPSDEFYKFSDFKQSDTKPVETEESDEHINEISLLGYSKLISPGASLRAKPTTSTSNKHHAYQNINFKKEATLKHIEDRLKSTPTTTYGSDSPYSLTSMKTSKSGRHDFIEASGEFNRNQPKEDKLIFSNKYPTSQPLIQLTSAREKIFGKDWTNKTIPESAKNETTAKPKPKEEGGIMKRNNESLKQETNKIFESKNEKDVSTKYSLEDDTNVYEEKSWPKNVLNEVNMKIGDGEEKSYTIDSADSGISTDINVINSPLKSPSDPPDIYQKSAINVGYKIYKLDNQSFQITKFEDKTKSNQNNVLNVRENKETANSDDLWQNDTGTKWRPMARQRTFSERQRTLKNLENSEVLSQTIQIKLDKTYPFIGLSISGGSESRACPDIIIDSVTRGSAADVEGSLKPGMKLKSVDGQSLVGKSHGEAVKIVKTSFLDKTQRWMEVVATT